MLDQTRRMDPVTDPQFVRSLYLGLLNREPDPHGFEVYVKRLQEQKVTHHGLAMELVNSPEFANRTRKKNTEIDLYSGFADADLRVFSAFDNRHVVPQAGFLTEWIGSRVRLTSLWTSVNWADRDKRVEALPVPGDYHAEAVEWIGMLKAVLAAKDSWSAMELGAGFGPWLAASSAAARARGITDIHLCGVEGDPGRFALLRQNMEDNQLADRDTLLLCAGVGVADGKARWPKIPNPSDVSGGRPIREGNADDLQSLPGQLDASDFIDIDIVGLPKLLDRRPVWDLVHIDIQGTEDELCAGCIGALSEKARYVIIGTHSRQIEGALMELFFQNGWVLEHEQPMKFAPGPRRSSKERGWGDGTQVWRNPKIGAPLTPDAAQTYGTTRNA